MISCTEFIPAYSELFSFLDERYGFAEVERFWADVFDPGRNGILNRKVEAAGLRGCYEYWSYSLNEEAADFVLMLNEADGWFHIEMRLCPSKSRLLSLEHMRPYERYCLHCDLYRKTIEAHGLCYDYDFTKCGRAQCNMLIYDPRKYKGRRVITPETLVMERRAQDNKYLHREFHNYMNMGVEYLGNRFGEGAVCAYLSRFARNYYAPLIKRVRAQGLPALRRHIEETYRLEEAEEVVHIDQEPHALRVQVDACPAAGYLQKAGWTPSRWFGETTRTVMRTIAQEAGLAFEMERYDRESGAAAYRFALNEEQAL